MTYDPPPALLIRVACVLGHVSFPQFELPWWVLYNCCVVRENSNVNSQLSRSRGRCRERLFMLPASRHGARGQRKACLHRAHCRRRIDHKIRWLQYADNATMALGTRVPSTCGLVACVSRVPAPTMYLDRVTATTVCCGSQPLIRVFCGFRYSRCRHSYICIYIFHRYAKKHIA